MDLSVLWEPIYEISSLIIKLSFCRLWSFIISFWWEADVIYAGFFLFNLGFSYFHSFLFLWLGFGGINFFLVPCSSMWNAPWRDNCISICSRIRFNNLLLLLPTAVRSVSFQCKFILNFIFYLILSVVSKVYMNLWNICFWLFTRRFRTPFYSNITFLVVNSFKFFFNMVINFFSYLFLSFFNLIDIYSFIFTLFIWIRLHIRFKMFSRLGFNFTGFMFCLFLHRVILFIYLLLYIL